MSATRCAMDRLFTLRVGLTGSHSVTIHAYDGNHTDPQYGHQRIDVRVVHCWTEAGKRKREVVFERGDTWCAVNRWASLDGDAAKELVLSLVAMKPGDTDSDYFAGYTHKQLAFVTAYGEDMDMARYSRFGEV